MNNSYKNFLFLYTSYLLLPLRIKRILVLFAFIFIGYISFYLLTLFLPKMISIVFADENTSSLITTKSNNHKSQEEVQTFYTKISNFWSSYKWYIVAGVTIGIGLLVFNLKGPNGDDSPSPSPSPSPTPALIQEIVQNASTSTPATTIVQPVSPEVFNQIQWNLNALKRPQNLWVHDMNVMIPILEELVPSLPLERRNNYLAIAISSLVQNKDHVYTSDIIDILKTSKITYRSNEWYEFVTDICTLIDTKIRDKGLSNNIYHELVIRDKALSAIITKIETFRLDFESTVDKTIEKINEKFDKCEKTIDKLIDTCDSRPFPTPVQECDPNTPEDNIQDEAQEKKTNTNDDDKFFENMEKYRKEAEQVRIRLQRDKENNE